MNGALKNFGMFCSHPRQPMLRTYREREIEDCGAFGVFWYRRPTGHTKTGARHRGETAWVAEWAYVPKGSDGNWRTGESKPGFKTRDEAVKVGEGCPHGSTAGSCSWCDLRDDGGLPEVRASLDK